MAAPTGNNVQIRVPESTGFSVTIEGLSPLLSDRMPDWALEDMRLKALGLPVPERKPHSIEERFRQSIYRTVDGRPGWPCSGLAQAMVAACRFNKLVMTKTRGSFFIEGIRAANYNKCNLLPIYGVEPVPLETTVANKNGAIFKVYAMYAAGWRITAKVYHRPEVITMDNLFDLISLAGFHVGIGVNRPELKRVGDRGRFRIVSSDE